MRVALPMTTESCIVTTSLQSPVVNLAKHSCHRICEIVALAVMADDLLDQIPDP
jgi:hypothetical protein